MIFFREHPEILVLLIVLLGSIVGSLGLYFLNKSKDSRSEGNISEGSPHSSTIDKVIQSVDWDISALVAAITTCTVCLLVFVGKSEQIPSEVYAAWAVIIGFYFGRKSNK